MTDAPTLSISQDTAGPVRSSGLVPPPLPPDDPEAWYAPDVRDQYEIRPGVVATIRDTETDFAYDIREPALSCADECARSRLESYFADANLTRPRTREGAVERMAAGFSPKYQVAIDRLTDLDHGSRRRVTYYALRDARCLGPMTPLALDDKIDVADLADDELVVHTDDYAPAATGMEPDPDLVRRFASERVTSYPVTFEDFSIDVVVYREHLLGSDSFPVKYAVSEPELLPGDRELIDECKERIWETGVGEVLDNTDAGVNASGVVEDSAAFVRERAKRFLSRQLTARNTRAWLDATRHRIRSALAHYGYAVPPADDRYARDRLDDLVYYVLRDYVGEGKLSIPIRDPHLEDIEANQVGERVKVVPRTDIGHDGRIPTNLVFEDETAFVNVVTQLAASDGTELNAATPSAKVNLDPDGVNDDVTIRCAVALPVVSEGGPHVSIRKQAAEALTPVDLVHANSISVDLVSLFWLAYEHHSVVLFAGPTGAGKTTLMNAHMPFVPYEDRPISIDEGSREVRLPHETGVSLTTRDHESEYKRVTMADLMTETNYLNPDVEVIAEINTPESFETFAETLNTGHGVLGTTHAEDVEKLVNRVVEQGLPAYLLRELDLVVFPKHVDGERYVGKVVELTDEPPTGPPDRHGTIEKDGTAIHWRAIAWREPDGGFAFADLDSIGFFETLADRTDRPVEDCHLEFERKRRYVEYLVRERVDDFDGLFGLVSDLRTNEAATVERLASNRKSAGRAHTDGGDGATPATTDGLDRSQPQSVNRPRGGSTGRPNGPTSRGEGSDG